MRYNISMVEIEIGTNEEGQRLDRFLRKYLKGAPLSLIYKIIRKDAKVNLKREKNVYILKDGDVIQLYLSADEIERFRGSEDRKQVRRTFRVVYEDDDILIVDKPAGLLTHGDKNEKSDHLTNQVQGYLMERGDFDPSREKTFAPSPVNRIDRNTTGLVIFAKNYATLKKFNEYIRDRRCIRKFYQTIVCGEIESEHTLTGVIEKDESRNVSRMTGERADGSGREHGEESGEAAETLKSVVTHVRPLRTGYIGGLGGGFDRQESTRAEGLDRQESTLGGLDRQKITLGGNHDRQGSTCTGGFDRQEFTLIEAEIETGRTHQIRVQLADAGHPLIGDAKYGDREVNKAFMAKYGLGHQLLTAVRLEFSGMAEEYPKLDGKTFQAKLPKVFEQIKKNFE